MGLASAVRYRTTGFGGGLVAVSTIVFSTQVLHIRTVPVEVLGREKAPLLQSGGSAGRKPGAGIRQNSVLHKRTST